MRFIASSIVVSEMLFLHEISTECVRSRLQRRFTQLRKRNVLRLNHLGGRALAEKFDKSGDATPANILIGLVATLLSTHEREDTFFRIMMSRSVRSGLEGRMVWRH